MLQHAAAVLQQLLPVWAAIAPDWQSASAAAAAAAGSSSIDSSSSSSSESDADSSCEDEAMPSLKEIAAHHQLMVAQNIAPALRAFLTALPSIYDAAKQQGSDKQLVVEAAMQQAWRIVVCTASQSETAAQQQASASVSGDDAPLYYKLWCDSSKREPKLGEQESAALACMAQLPFAFDDVLQVAAGATAAAGAVPVPTTPAGGTAAAAGIGRGAGSSSKQRSSSTQSSSRSPTPSASPQQAANTLQPSPRSSSSSRSWGCHYAGCTNLCGVSELAMPVYGCSGCRSADYSYACTYCSSACQQADWPVHKLACRQVRRQSSKGQQQQQQQQQQ
jgi:hypothetical protein